jgi:hypothetical protein
VHQRVPYPHRPHRVDQVPTLAVGGRHGHLGVLPLGQEPVDRIGQLDHGALHQAQQRDPGDRLGHRVPPPDRLIRERFAAMPVHGAETAAVCDPTATGHEHLAGDDLSGVEVPGAKVFVDTREPVGVESGRLRVRVKVKAHECSSYGSSAARRTGRAPHR